MYAPTDNVVPPRSMLMRLLVRRWVYRHPRIWSAVCFVAGTWLFILGSILCVGGFWWGALLIAIAALELWVGYRIPRSVPG